MAALSMGAFGLYKQGYSKYLQELEQKEKDLTENHKETLDTETVWIVKRYAPTDLRSTVPVPRHKILAPQVLPPADRNWLPSIDPPLRSFERTPSAFIYSSHAATRSEDYSTLRQMLPSTGGVYKLNPPNWGTATSIPPVTTERPPKRFPIVNSPMTRYIDDMHQSNRLFRLY